MDSVEFAVCPGEGALASHHMQRRKKKWCPFVKIACGKAGFCAEFRAAPKQSSDPIPVPADTFPGMGSAANDRTILMPNLPKELEASASQQGHDPLSELSSRNTTVPPP
jgi:hypothetical protein